MTPSTVLAPAALRPRRIGRGVLGRGLPVIPRRHVCDALLWRVLLDQAPLRLFVALAALPLAFVLPPGLALTLTPVAMVGALITAERTFLSASGPPAARRALIGDAEAAQALDLLQVRARDALGRIAAGRDMATERLHLVIEQSALARAPVLTLVSVQRACPTGKPEVMDLTEGEREMLRARLFGGGLDEPLLLLVNRAQNRFVRQVPFEAQTVSAHARLLARAGRPAAAPA